jgi:TonB family protein
MSATVVHEDIPSVPAQARATIHGHIKVIVRVTIDNTGAVVGDSLVRPGPSKYFARMASESARRWRFDPAGGSGSRQAVIRYEFTRSGTTAHRVTPD